MIPSHLRLLFWDIDPEGFDPAEYPRYTIGRVLEYGDRDEVDWMRGRFTEEQILHALRTDRGLTPLSANFWALVYGVPPEEVAALGGSS